MSYSANGLEQADESFHRTCDALVNRAFELLRLPVYPWLVEDSPPPRNPAPRPATTTPSSRKE